MILRYCSWGVDTSKIKLKYDPVKLKIIWACFPFVGSFVILGYAQSLALHISKLATIQHMLQLPGY